MATIYTFTLNDSTFTAKTDKNGKPIYLQTTGTSGKRISKDAYEQALAEYEDAQKPKKRGGGRSIQGNRQDGKYTIIRRNDDLIRLVNGANQTVAIVIVKKKVCSIHTAALENMGAYKEEAFPFEMGPNHYKLSCTFDNLNARVTELFGEGEPIISTKVDEAEETPVEETAEA